MNFGVETAKTRNKNKKRREQQKMYIILIAFFSLAAIILLVTYLILMQGNKTKRIPVNQPTTTIKETKKKKLEIFDESSDERPIAVMIDNAIGDEKNAGLQDSYLNYEIIVEGGLTRIMAIYKNRNSTLVGPIRSARNYFLDYALESDTIYVHYGWSPSAEKDIKTLDINNINGITDTTPFRRDTKLQAPHNVFSKLNLIKDYLSQKNYNDTTSNWKLLNYNASNVDLNDTDYVPKEAHKIEIVYSKNEYRSYSYDSGNEYYLRSQNGSAHVDKYSNNQLHYKNIIIQRVSNKTIDSEGRQELETTGSGTGYFITNGYFLPIKWEKQSRKGKTTYLYENGMEIEINDGNTFIQIVPKESKITIE